MFVRSAELLAERVPDGAADAYPWALPAVRGLGRLELDRPVTILVGENGSGKSTLVEALAVALGLNAEGGTQNMSFATRASHSPLHDALRIARDGSRPRTSFFLRAESAFTLATAIDDLGGTIPAGFGGSLHERSHGEAFLAIANNRFTADGLYLLDEPEAALSPQGLLALMRRIADLVAERSQFVIATHAPILMAYPGARLYECAESGLAEVAYDDIDHVRLTRAILDDPQRFLRRVLE